MRKRVAQVEAELRRAQTRGEAAAAKRINWVVCTFSRHSHAVFARGCHLLGGARSGKLQSCGHAHSMGQALAYSAPLRSSDTVSGPSFGSEKDASSSVGFHRASARAVFLACASSSSKISNCAWQSTTSCSSSACTLIAACMTVAVALAPASAHCFRTWASAELRHSPPRP